MNEEHHRLLGHFIAHVPRDRPRVKSDKKAALDAEELRVRRRTEDILEASRLEREALLDVYDLSPRELEAMK